MRTFILAAALTLVACAAPAQNRAPAGALPPFRTDAELTRFIYRVSAPPACASSRVATTGPLVVHGRVTALDSVPAAASVRIPELGLSTVADSDGAYRLVIPRPVMNSAQSFAVRAGRLGSVTTECTLAAIPGDSITVDFRLMGENALHLDEIVATTADRTGEPESVTNVQHEGVDEGGIVKVHGGRLVILRRGRLFTVAIGGDTLAPVSSANAYGTDVGDPDGAWYDEMLISGGNVVVIGYNYERGGTEVGLFRIDNAGHLDHRATYHFRSDDYYSSVNYASRLIGTKLVLYMPLQIRPGEDVVSYLPAMRRWHQGATDAEFRRVSQPGTIHHPGLPLGRDDDLSLHTVLTCELGGAEMECRSTTVLGPSGRVFYVSPSAVYVWAVAETRGAVDRSMLYRIPLDRGNPSALRVSGSPINQFSFLESDDGRLNVLVSDTGHGDGMWAAEKPAGGLSLLRVPISRFGDGRRAATSIHYRQLPTSGGAVQNRFVGSYLLYAVRGGAGMPNTTGQSAVVAVRWRGGSPTSIPLPHAVERMEQMGDHAVVVGARGSDLHFTGIDLGGLPRAVRNYVQRDASQEETRSHGFFYRVDGADSGIIGIPVRNPEDGLDEDGSASVLFLRNADARFHRLGELAASAAAPADDGCVVSCVDWYGNARPLFLNGRVFALLGYELVEGTVAGSVIRERRRISYAPKPR
ncbi:MAG TPA: beta-propeller domain-containing protein [Longimicrobium sp.]|jgi:hypothetical protein